MSMTFDDDRILTNFLNSKGKPICREERQYALFFYNALLDVKRKGNWEAFRKLIIIEKNEKDNDNSIDNFIKKMLGVNMLDVKNLNDIHIKQVFYEATLMRDFFNSCNDDGKKNFNENLLEFVLSYNYKTVSLYLEDGECDKYKNKLSGSAHFGSSSKSNKLPQEIRNLILKDPKGSKKERKEFEKNEKEYIIASRLQLAKYMMNATPDILVYYTITLDDKEQEYVRAIECKYESGIGTYEDIFGKRRPLQIFVQRLIMTFLFGAELIEKEECGLVQVDDKIWNKVYGDLPIDINKKENNESNVENKKVTVKQSNLTNDKAPVGNMGVTVVQFISEDEQPSKKRKSQDGFFKIPISKLLQEQYASRNEKTSLNDR